MRAIARSLIFAPLLLALGASPVSPARAQPSAAPAAELVRIDESAIAREVASLEAWVSEQGGKVGVQVVEVRSGRILAEAHPHLALNPASNAKLLTAAVALDELGADYRYTTGVYGSIEQGSATSLVLRGHGDPSLGVADLAELARVLVDMGLKRVTGDILVDQSRFDAQYVPPAFGQQPHEWASFRAPISAVALERNAVTLNVLATRPGEPARTWYHPAGVVDSSGQIETRATGAGQAVTWSLQPAGSRLRARIGGHLAAGLPRLRFSRRVDDPTLLPGFAFRHLLEQLGVEVQGKVAPGGSDEKRRLVFHESAPLTTLLDELGKKSDNFYAEMIFKSLGATEDGKPATSEAGARVVLDWLRQLDAADGQTTIRNGSGLFDADRVSAQTLARALRAVYRDPRLGADFVGQLAIGGVDGTLKWRFRQHRDERSVRAKTGTLAQCDALGGYVLGADGDRVVAFSLILNGPTNHRESRRRMDRVVDRIVAALKHPT